MINQKRGRRKKNDRAHEYIPVQQKRRRRRRIGVSVRPKIIDTNRPQHYQIGSQVTISIKKNPDGGHQLSLGGSTRQWGIRDWGGGHTVLVNTDGISLTVGTQSITRLLDKLPGEIAVSVVNGVWMGPYALVNGWTGEISSEAPLTAAQAREKNHHHKHRNTDFRWVKVSEVSTVKAYVHTDGTYRVMSAEEAAKYNAVYERQDAVRKKHGYDPVGEHWEPIPLVESGANIEYFI